MKVCVRAHDFETKGVNSLITASKDAGAQGLQLVCYKSFDDIAKKQGAITEVRAKEIAEAFRKDAIETVLLGAYFNPVHSNKGKVKEGIDIFRDYLRLGRMLGCEIVGSETGSYNDEPWIYHPKNRTDEALTEICRVFGDLCDYAQEYGMTVGIEGAAGHVCYDVDTLGKALEIINRPNITVIFDLYNFLDETNYQNYLGILRDGLEKFAGRIHCFHIKDCKFNSGNLQQCAVGQGDMDFDKIVQMIKEYDEQAVLILEGTKKEYIETSIRLLKDQWNNNSGQ